MSDERAIWTRISSWSPLCSLLVALTPDEKVNKNIKRPVFRLLFESILNSIAWRSIERWRTFARSYQKL
jgi:hypothetical protein